MRDWILIPFFVACYLVSFPYHELVATGLFIIASVTDWLDGHLARKYNQVTTLGKFLDPVADKLLVCSALVLVCVIDNAFSIPVLIASIIIISRELVITCFRTIAATKTSLWRRTNSENQNRDPTVRLVVLSALPHVCRTVHGFRRSSYVRGIRSFNDRYVLYRSFRRKLYSQEPERSFR